MFCNDVCSVMEVLGHEYNPDQWHLFIDSSKVSLKVVLLHNGNRFPSIPLAHAANMKENYENMKLLLGKIKYDELNWKLCGDLKVVALLLRMHLEYTKYCCFLRESDSRDKNNHYVNKLWPKRTSLMQSSSCSSRENLSAPLHIKMNLMRNFVKGMDNTDHGFQYVRNKFPNTSDAKIKEGIFIGPHIRELMQGKQFNEDLNETERNAWLSFKWICKDFLGNHYQDVVQDLFTSYEAMGCNMSLKIHFLESHLDFFPENLGKVIDEHSERFYQDIMATEKQYQGKWTSSMLADYCCTMKRNVPDAKYWWKSYTSTFYRKVSACFMSTCKELSCTFKFFCIFETLPDRRILYT